MIELIRHHVPTIKNTKAKFIFISKWCCFCDEKLGGYIFRVNTKLKVFKCYNCGRSGKDFNRFKNHLKIRKESDFRASKMVQTYEVQPERNYTLPF